jgi:hypothetical protein
LFAIQLLFPVTFLIVFIDQFILNHKILEQTPASPEEWKWFAIIFGTPHVISSTFSFFDSEYLQAYRKPLLLFAFFIAPWAFFPGLTALRTLMSVFAFWTVYHAGSQLAGIARTNRVGVNPRVFEAWKWSAVLSVYFSIELYLNDWTWRDATPHDWATVGWVVLTTGFLTMTLFICPWRQSGFGKWLVFGVFLWTMLSSFFWLTGYGFFAALTSRVVHDVTAYCFYTAHDESRSGERPGANWLYNFVGRCSLSKLPIWVGCIALGILLSYGLGLFVQSLRQVEGYSGLGNRIILLFAFFHYFMEATIWKRSSLHRRYVRIAL